MSYQDEKQGSTQQQQSESGSSPVQGVAPGKRTLAMNLPAAGAPVQQKAAPATAGPGAGSAALTNQWMNTAMRPDLHPGPVQRKEGDGAAVPNSVRWSEPMSVIITASKLRVRSAPTTSGDNIVGGYVRGTRVDAWGKQGDWLVVTHEGETAYIHGGHVKPAEAAQPGGGGASSAGGAGASSAAGGTNTADSASANSADATTNSEGAGAAPTDQGAAESLAGMIVSFLSWLGDLIAPSSEEKDPDSGAGGNTPEVGPEGGTTPGTGGGGTTPGEGTDGGTTPAGTGGTRFFAELFEVVDDNALLRDTKFKPTGKKIAPGTKVYVVAAQRTYVQIVTAAGAAEVINEADKVWTSFGNLGGRGADVALGNEATDEADKQKADELRGGLPEGRKPGQSPFKWKFSGSFQPSLEGKNLESTLMSKVYRLMQWAIANDMVTSDIVISDGVRGPKTAHRICVAWEIQYGPGRVTFDSVKALPGGKDADGNLWYRDGWTWEEVKANAKSVRSSSKIAAAGHEYGDPARAPLPINSRPGVSRHCTGRAVDVTIPWRAPGKPVSANKTDVWAWEDIYKQFGLHRPLHKDKVSKANLQENWHIEETSKKLEGNEDTV